jgi:ribosomal protein S18 acetylase RimI-like enzyme
MSLSPPSVGCFWRRPPVSHEVVQAELDDIEPWMGLTAEVDALFGHPMSTDLAFRETLVRNIARGSAFVVRASPGLAGGPLAGALLWQPTRHEISWLAVAQRHQRLGIGQALVAHALSLATVGREVTVVTFGPSMPEGAAARALYRGAGFVETSRKAPTALDRVVLVRPCKPS